MIQLLIAILLGLANPSSINHTNSNDTVVSTNGVGDGIGDEVDGGGGTTGTGGNNGQLPPPPITGG